jgi:signal transduction histidine kinase
VRRADFFLFFFLPFAGIIALFFLFSSFNRAYIQEKTQDLVREQLQATAEILKVNVSHFLEDGYSPEKIVEFSAGEEGVYYLALLDGEKNILGWKSRYEGYLPLSKEDRSRTGPWIISSPAGQIFNLLAPLSVKSGQAYSLYLGYSLSRLDEMLARSNRNFLLVFGFVAAAGIIFFSGVFRLQKNYLAKTREAEEEKRAKERFRQISAFTSAVAHEIKNPLNSLSLLCDLLQRKGPPEDRAEVAQGKAEVRRISEIVDRFSDALKPFRLNRQAFALREAVLTARDSLAVEYPRPEVEFRYHESGPVTLFADKLLLIQCLGNLLRNAFEATDKGTISVEAEKTRRRVTIRISDTGKGIRPDELGRIFDPFFTTKDKGMGIGLYLAKKIVEAHEGRIEARSGPGRGTTFIIHLPGGRHE